MKKILVTGANGMLATDFIRVTQGMFEIVAYDKSMLDITDISHIRKALSQEKPDIILNCAAYTNVDYSEESGKKLAFDINTLGVYNLAKVSYELHIDFITISTDYVFDGQSNNGYKEDDEQNPINTYGMSKYLGEYLSREEYPDTIIIRTSWLYGGGKIFKNFVNTMIKLAETRTELKVVSDQFGSPTYAVDLSLAIVKIIDNIEKYRGAILHLSNETSSHGISWYEFACEIFALTHKNIHITPCSSLDFPSKATRPQYSKLQNHSDIILRNWREGLMEYIKNL